LLVFRAEFSPISMLVIVDILLNGFIFILLEYFQRAWSSNNLTAKRKNKNRKYLYRSII
jgi:hypothetical protein